MSNRDETQQLQLAFSLHRSGKFGDAAKIYRKIIKRNPRQPHALHSLGIIEAANGNNGEAAQLMARSLSVQATNLDFMQNYATVLCQLGRFEAAREVCRKGLEIDANHVHLLYVLANSLLKLDRLQEALVVFDQVLRIEPNHVAAITERSTVLIEARQYDAARADIERALSLDPRCAEAYHNQGVLHTQLGRYDEALASFNRSLVLNPNLAIAWVGRGNILFSLKHHDEATAAYDKALSLQSRSAEAWLGRGNVLFDLQRHDEALAAYDRAISFQTDLAEAWLGRGNVLFDLKRHDEALAAYDRALALNPHSAEAWAGRANVLTSLHCHDDAFAAYDQAFSVKPDLPGVEGERLHARLQCCVWENFDAGCEKLTESIRSNKANATPFKFLALSDSASDQLKCARSWVAKKIRQPTTPLWRKERRSRDRIRLGYVSADFREHPVAYLSAGIFECHDRSQFEVVGLSIGPNDNSELRRRLERSFDKFIDGAACGIGQIADRIVEEEIDVLIDLSGFTTHAGPQIFALRPAPIQVNYLGYPGTMGADFTDYIVADPVLIPVAHQENYTEKVAYLPNSYLPHDEGGRLMSDRRLERADFGLPEHAFVFCCFNSGYKLNPGVFGTYAKLLNAVKDSVLWLSERSEPATANLRKEAAAAGINPDRLVFAQRLPSSADHLARHRLADLFLDTWPYNAHTTASDALWAGLPVLTRIGETFAGRVAASLLRAVGLTELITESRQQFESLAIDLATEPLRLAAIKDTLARNRSSAALFDTSHYTRQLEALYAQMYRRLLDGASPDHIYAEA